jgi:hypothetical protein
MTEEEKAGDILALRKAIKKWETNRDDPDNVQHGWISCALCVRHLNVEPHGDIPGNKRNYEHEDRCGRCPLNDGTDDGGGCGDDSLYEDAYEEYNNNGHTFFYEECCNDLIDRMTEALEELKA